MGLPFGLVGILIGLAVGHVFDMMWDRRLSSSPYGQETEELIPLLFGLYGRVVAHGESFTNTQALFLQTLVIPQLRLRPTDQSLALTSFKEALEIALKEAPGANQGQVRSLAEDIYEGFFLDRRTLLWIYATCRQLASLGNIRPGIVEVLDTISKEFFIYEETGSAGVSGHSYQQADEQDYRRQWQEFQPSGAAGPEAYASLGVTAESTNDEIKKAYRNLVRQYHPDSLSHLSEQERKHSSEKFIGIQQAYERIKKTRNFT